MNRNPFTRLARDLRGQDLIEYALLGAFVASCAVALFPAISATGNYFSQVVNVLSAAIAVTAGS